jgi:hypothetical protein
MFKTMIALMFIVMGVVVYLGVTTPPYAEKGVVAKPPICCSTPGSMDPR